MEINQYQGIFVTMVRCDVVITGFKVQQRVITLLPASPNSRSYTGKEEAEHRFREVVRGTSGMARRGSQRSFLSLFHLLFPIQLSVFLLLGFI